MGSWPHNDTSHTREQQGPRSTGCYTAFFKAQKWEMENAREMFFLLSGLILLLCTCLRWFYSHTAAEKWLNKGAPFFILCVIFVV